MNERDQPDGFYEEPSSSQTAPLCNCHGMLYLECPNVKAIREQPQTHEGGEPLIDERCYFCNKALLSGEPCIHKEVTPEVAEAANILSGVEFCDHFCCGMPENLCRAVRLAAAMRAAGQPEHKENKMAEDWSEYDRSTRPLEQRLSDLLCEKEVTIANHIRQAASDGCQCEPCVAAREALSRQPEQPREALRDRVRAGLKSADKILREMPQEERDFMPCSEWDIIEVEILKAINEAALAAAPPSKYCECSFSPTSTCGCEPCPKCGSKYRYQLAAKPEDILCDDCGFVEHAIHSSDKL